MLEMKRIHICDQPHTYWYEYIYNTWSPSSPHNSKHLFDIYTLTHIFWPLLLTYMAKRVFPLDIRMIIIITLLVVYFEIHENNSENVKKYNRIERDSSGKSSYRGDSTINIIGDILANLVGIYLGYTIGSTTQIVLILAILYFIVTDTVGLRYWREFFRFLLEASI